MVKKQRKPALVEVTWVDARDVFESSMSLEDCLKYDLIERTHVGYLVSQDEVRVRIAAGIDEDGFDNLVILPSGWIKQLKVVRHATKGGKADAVEAKTQATTEHEAS